MTKRTLLQRRHKIDSFKQNMAFHLPLDYLDQSIVSSWQRSDSAAIPKERIAAPMSQNHLNHQPNTLKNILEYCEKDLKRIAEQSSMAIAVGDIGSTIIWSAASASMRSAAEKVNFTEGGQWHEDLVGTNALALSLKTKKSCCVFSNEHYMSSIQDWVCYATPIFDSQKNIVGVIDLSTTWNNHNSLGILAVERCASIIQNALLEYQKQHLFIQAFNKPQVFLNQKKLSLTPRQIEIVTILALYPQGLELDNLHQVLYGNRLVSFGTLKAEMCYLRKILGNLIGSRPYRLLSPVDGDFLQVEKSLDKGYSVSALQSYTGVFLAKTESPFLCSWRDALEARLSNILYQAKESDLLLQHIARFPEAVDAAERLMDILPFEHPVQQLLVKYTE